MPVRLQQNSPGLLPITPSVSYGDPYAGAKSVKLASAANGLAESAYGVNRPGTPGAGLSFADAMALSSIGNLTYAPKVTPLSLPSSVTTIPGSGGNTVRTGSLELNMLDLGATVRMASGQFIGSKDPVFGVEGQGGIVQSAMDLFGQYSSAPAKIMDYGIAVPLAWSGLVKNPESIGINGASKQPFEQDPAYWKALANIDSDEGLMEMADIVARSTVGTPMVAALREQLMAIFKADQLALTGLSSGNDRTDYLAKKAFQQALDMEAHGGKFTGVFKNAQEAQDYWSKAPGDTLGALVATWGGGFATFAQEAFTGLLPFVGTQIAGAIEPISAEAEARWLAATPEKRREFLGFSQTTMMAVDLAVAIPLFSGVGAVMGVMRTAAGGAEFASAVGESGNAFINMAKQAAWALGKPGVRMPSILTEGGNVGRVLGSRFAVPEVVHLSNLYDGVLHVAKIALAEGVGAWTLNWAAKSLSPEYAKTLGRQIDNSHFVSESSLAGAVDMIGLFTGGTLGAGTFARFTKGMGGEVAAKAGLKSSVFNFAYENFMGGQDVAGVVGKAVKMGVPFEQLPFKRQLVSEMQRWVQDRKLEEAARDPSRAAEIMATAAITETEATEVLTRVMKAASERRWGIETEGWMNQHEAVKSANKQLVDDLARQMELHNGNPYWSRKVGGQIDPATGKPMGYNHKSLQAWVAKSLKSIGIDGEAAVREIDGSAFFRTKIGDRAKLDPWRQAANNVNQYLYDHFSGMLQSIQKAGTSETAGMLFLERTDHLFQEVINHFLSLRDKVKDGTAVEADVAMLEKLRTEMVTTPEIGQWWARQRNWNNEGTRKIEDISADALDTYLRPIKEHFPGRRGDPGPLAQEGELNDLARQLAEQGDWTLAFKPTEVTAAGIIEEQMAAAEAAVKAWTDAEAAARNVMNDADAAYWTVYQERQTAYYDKYTAPLERQHQYVVAEEKAELDAARKPVDDYFAEMQKFHDSIPDDRPMTAAEKATADAMHAQDAKNTIAFAKKANKIADKYSVKKAAITKKINASYDKRAEQQNKDPALKAVDTAKTEAQEAWRLASQNKPLGYRIGPVPPEGFTPDLRVAIDEAYQNLAGPDAISERQIDTARVLDPTAGEGLYHVTTNWSKVQAEGLKGKDVLEREGMDTGMGGGNIPDGVSLSWTKAQADMNAHQMEGARKAANGEMSMEDLLAHFKNLPKMLSERGRNFYNRLNEGNDGIFMDPTDRAGRYDSMKNADGTPRFHSYDEYRQWLKDELVKPDSYEVFYGDPETVARKLSEFSAFDVRWQTWLDEWRIKHPTVPTWGPDGELILSVAPTKHTTYLLDGPYAGLTVQEASVKLDELLTASGGSATILTTDLVREIIKADAQAQRTFAPTDMEKWQGILEILTEDKAVYNWRAGVGGVTDAYIAFQKLDQRLPAQPGGMTYILKDGSQFVGKTADDIGVVRVSVNPRAFSLPEHSQWGPDPGELRVHQDEVFVHKVLPDQAFADPIEFPMQSLTDLGPTHVPVSYVTVRDPVTGEVMHLKTPFMEYPHNADSIELGNRNLLARKWDDLTQGYKTWRITEYMKGQTHRIFTTKYDVLPEQVDALIAGAFKLGYEKWGPSGGRRLAVPLGYQSAAAMRTADIERLAMNIFGKTKNELTGEFTPAPILNKITGKMEVPNYPDLLTDGFRQAWTLNLTAGLTSKFYSMGVMGHAGSMIGTWLVPLLRYSASPIFKASELVESAMFNVMRGSGKISPEMRREYAKLGMPTRVGQIADELAGGDSLAAGLMGGLPTVEEAARLHPNGLSDLNDLAFGDGLAAELKAVGKERYADSKVPGPLRDGWDNLVNPTPFKDLLAADLSVKAVRDTLPALMRKTNRTGFDFYTKELKVPESELADFIVHDRYLYQSWVDGTATFDEMIGHHAKYNPSLKETPSAELTAFYNSEAWQATETLFRLNARASQAEAFGVHYFGAYRSSLERSINHPLLGIYPASWAYKAAKEWFKFLFDNRTFGAGELRLGATPAAYLQTTIQAQSIAWAQNNDESMDEWLRKGPWANAFFIFNLLLPGDWSNLPFPASRSIRMIARSLTGGNGDGFDPIQHVQQNIFGPQGRGGIGVIRDFNLTRLGVTDAFDAMVNPDETPWTKLSKTLTSNTGSIPFDWNAMTKYPSRTLTQPLNAP